MKGVVWLGREGVRCVCRYEDDRNPLLQVKGPHPHLQTSRVGYLDMDSRHAGCTLFIGCVRRPSTHQVGDVAAEGVPHQDEALLGLGGALTPPLPVQGLHLHHNTHHGLRIHKAVLSLEYTC
jgi:hypothetical protein